MDETGDYAVVGRLRAATDVEEFGWGSAGTVDVFDSIGERHLADEVILREYAAGGTYAVWSGEANSYTCDVYGSRRDTAEAESSQLTALLSAAKRRLEDVEDVIRTVASPHSSASAERIANTLSELWQRLDHATELVEARMRLQLRRLRRIKLVETPEWLKERLGHLAHPDEDGSAPHPAVLDTCDLLVRSYLAVNPELPRPEVSAGPLGTAMMEWNFPTRRLQWLVSACNLSWPAVAIHSMLRCGDGEEAVRRVKIFHLAEEAINDVVTAAEA
jgi:hypothetical protein